MATVAECSVNDREGILRALHRTSCVLIRDALPADRLRAYSEAMRAFHSRMASLAEHVPESEESHRADVLRTLGLQGGMSLGLRTEDRFEAPECSHDIGGMIRASGMLQVAGEFFGDDAGFLVDNCSMRRQASDALDRALPFHQDGPPAAMPSADYPGLVFWIPLVPIDPETAGLEVVALKIDEFLPHRPTPGSYYSEIDADHAELERRYREHLVRTPDMRVGDMLLFTFTFIHRTYVTESMTKPRFSLDLRCVPLTGLPPTYRGTWGFPRAVEASSGLRPFYFIVAFWGQEYRERFLKLCLPSLLAPNNIPAPETPAESRFLICTTREDWASVEDHPTFRLLRRHIKAVFMEIDPPQSDAFRKWVLAKGFNQGATRAFEDRAYGVFLSPDQVLSDGSVAELARLARDGKKVVLGAELRCETEGCLEELERLGPMRPGEPTTLPARTLAGIALRNLHPGFRCCAWHSPAFASAPVAALWRAPGGSGMVMHSLEWTPLLVDYAAIEQHRIEGFETGTPYDDHIPRNFAGEGDAHVITDSDRITLVQLSKEVEPLLTPETHWAKRVPILAGWVKTTLLRRAVDGVSKDPLKRRFLPVAVRIHAAPISTPWRFVEWRAARRIRRADRPVSALRERSVERVLAFRPYRWMRARLSHWIRARSSHRKTHLAGHLSPEWRRRIKAALGLSKKP